MELMFSVCYCPVILISDDSDQRLSDNHLIRTLEVFCPYLLITLVAKNDKGTKLFSYLIRNYLV